MGYQSKPIKTYAETDILKDSDIWDYLKYLQLNRINWLSSTIWDNDKLAKNQLLNEISAINQMEFMCWEKIGLDDKKEKDYLSKKPLIFKKIINNTQELQTFVTGDPFKQLQLQMQITDWLKLLDKHFSTMKRMKKTAFISGVGEAGAENIEQQG